MTGNPWLDANPHLVALLRSAKPELRDEPNTRQVEAWVELADADVLGPRFPLIPDDGYR